MQVVESKVGKISFKLPNIAEGPELLALCGLNSKNAADEDWFAENDLLIVSRVIKHMHFLIKESVIDGKVIKEYSDLLETRKARKLVMDVATQVLESLGEDEEKKP